MAHQLSLSNGTVSIVFAQVPRRQHIFQISW